MSASPLISIIIPVYNVKQYLRKCADSVLRQTYRHLEIILVDDGSTDSSGEMCDRLARQDDRIRVVHKRNAGLGMARNSGLDIAKGEFVMFVDSDDFVDTCMVEKLYAQLERRVPTPVTAGIANTMARIISNRSRRHTTIEHSANATLSIMCCLR